MLAKMPENDVNDAGRALGRFVQRIFALLLLAASAAASPAVAAPPVDWLIEVDPAAPGVPLPPALLGHYDLLGELLAYDQEPGLDSAMSADGCDS